MAQPIHVLLIEDDPADARLVEVMLSRAPRPVFSVSRADRLAPALALLRENHVNVVLADLSLPDSAGLSTLEALLHAAPHIPVLVLTGNDDDAQAIDAVKHGAQDYLVKGQGDAVMLSRVIRYAIERKATERQLTEARDKAEAAARAKSLFLATIGHEIRTPLNGILGMSRLLQDTSLDIQQTGFVDAVAASGELLLSLVNDILDFTQLESERLPLQQSSFHLPVMIEQLRALMAPKAGDKKLSLSIRIAPNTPSLVVGDAARLRQILANLVDNAIKFTERGGVVLAVEKVGGNNHGSALLRFTVADTGQGIAPEKQHEVFDAFSQGDNSFTRRHGGAGLGLAICKRLVSLMDGEIGYDSHPGQGSTFWVEILLPVGKETDSAPISVDNGARRILLVDDNAVNLEVAAGLLRGRGHHVTEVISGLAAVEAASKAPFDLVLLDMQMPGIDGIETGRRIRALGEAAAALPLWLLTANATREMERSWREAGIDGCLPKPFRVEHALRLLDATSTSAPHAPPSATQTKLPPINLTELQSDVRDLGLERVKGLVNLYRQTAGADLSAAEAAAEQGDLAELGRLVHRMASSSSSLHLEALAQYCRAMEDACRAEDSVAQPQTSELRHLWESSLEALDMALK